MAGIAGKPQAPTPVLVVVGNSEGGGARVALDLLAALDPARYRATLVAPDAPTVAAWASEHGVAFAPTPLLRSRLGGEALTHLRALIARLRPGIIHAHGTRAMSFVARCVPARGAPALLYSEHLFSFEARRGPARLPWLALEAALCRRADAMTTSCERNAQYAERVRRRPVALRHYGIDVSSVQRQAARAALASASSTHNLPADATLIGSVGRLIPQKGLSSLIAAAPAIIAEAPAARFVIVGDGPERAALEAQARVAGLAERFIFAGALAEPWALLARCDVIALPSLWEGLPLTLLEALAVGAPVVASDVGGAREALGPLLEAGLTPPRDPAALAQRIIWLLGDAALRARFQQEGPAIAARYDIRRTQQACGALYDTLCVGDALAQLAPT